MMTRTEAGDRISPEGAARGVSTQVHDGGSRGPATSPRCSIDDRRSQISRENRSLRCRVRADDLSHCFRHGQTHRTDEPCAGCEVERLQRERRAEDPLAEFKEVQQQLHDLRDFRAWRKETTGRNQMVKTRCKVRCQRVSKIDWGNGQIVHEAEFSCVTDRNGGEENKSFFASTPSGRINLQTVREDHFQAGQDYYVDFTPCVAATNAAG